jgi:hypothetical protein
MLYVDFSSAGFKFETKYKPGLLKNRVGPGPGPEKKKVIRPRPGLRPDRVRVWDRAWIDPQRPTIFK